MRGWRLAVLMVAAAGVWYWRLESGRLGLEEGQRVRIVGRVSGQPAIKTDKFSGEEYQWVGMSVGSESFWFRTQRWPEVGYGDRLEVEGRLQAMTNDKFLISNKLPMTKLRKWLAPKRWVVEVGNKTYRSDRSNKAYDGEQRLGAAMTAVRQRVLELFRRTLPRREAGLLSGMVLGTKGELDDGFMEDLRKSGVMHVVVASGFNVMLVGGSLVSILLLWVRRQVAVLLSIVGIVGYVGLVGFEAPVVRAALMGSLAMMGIALGRVRDAGWLLILSAVLMLWWKPEWLWDVGFQLSVAATAGLVWISPLLKAAEENRSALWRRPMALLAMPVVGESLTTTLAAQVAVFPIIMTQFGQWSGWSILVNVLLLWMVPVVTGVGMVSGFWYLVAGNWLGKPVAEGFLWLIWPLFKLFVVVVELFGRTQVWDWQMPGWGGLIYYGVLIWWIKREWKRIRTKERE